MFSLHSEQHPVPSRLVNEPAIEQDQHIKRLYEVSRDIVGPVIVGFAQQLLEEADGRKIVFAARDGLGTYTAARVLQDRFHEPNPDQLAYAYLTRRVVFRSGALAVGRHLEQLGVQREDEALVADIGMYGSFAHQMREVLPHSELRYLISRHPSIPGYADGPAEFRMKSMQGIVGNPAVHFLEDTYAGPIQSPSRLIEAEDGTLIPNTAGMTYTGAIALKRQVALRGIYDHATSLTSAPDASDMQPVHALDELLVDPKNYADLMVPHE